MFATFVLTLAGALPLASAHIAMFHPSMYGFNWTDADSQTITHYDNRPVAPLQDMTFDQWWFHGHLNYPPNPGDFFELPVGQAATTELACDKSHTSFFASKAEDSGFDLQRGNDPCPADDNTPFPNPAMHTNGFNDLKGCALAIAYESDVTKIKPEDFTVFSTNQTCVWTRFTDFQVPARMPPCPEDGCHCAWFWIHADDSGGEQNYMNGFKCKVTNSTSNVALAKPKVPRRCGADPDYDKADAAPGNCTYGAKQPFYWFQKEQNNMFEGQYAPPFYTDLYNFKDGAQDDIFVDSYPADLPEPSPNSTFVPTPFLGPAPGASSSEPSAASSSATEPASTVDASASSVAGSSASVQSATAAPTSIAAISSAPSSTLLPSSSVTISTLSQPAAVSASASSSIPEPSLPLSTDSASLPSFTQSSSLPASSSVVVSTSLVVSTVVVTVTAQPAPTSIDGAGTAPASPSSTVASPGSSILSSSSISVSDSVGVSTGVATSVPPSSTFMATQSVSSAPASADSQSIVAASTIVLGPKPSSGAAGGKVLAASTGSSTIVRPAVLAADSTASGKVCKRAVGTHKVFRRRAAVPSPSTSPQEPMGRQAEEEESSLLSYIPGVRRHRKLSNRSRLWSFF